MITKHEARVAKDTANNKVTVVKEFDADVQQVWKAWTDSTILDKWWAPKPWRAETNKMNFKEGGAWLYSMVGPEGERHYGRADYTKIEKEKSFTVSDSFTDEKGNKNPDMPSTTWNVKFLKTPNGTKVEIVITGNNEGDVERMLDMGFEEGFKMGLDNLDELLAK